jgi:hypothetical protein
MKRVLLLLLLSALARLAAASPPTLAAARQACGLLGPGVWARILRIENANPHSAYPATVYAAVFEFGGILWFYTGMDGTQSFSLHRGRLAAEKADFRPLLRAVEPGFADFAVLPREAAEARPAGGRLPEGCFIESVAALRDCMARGVALQRAALLTYYRRCDGRLHGHTVLAYETDREAYFVDQAWRPGPQRLKADWQDAMAVAREVQGDGFAGPIADARWIPVPARQLERVAVAGRPARTLTANG